MDNRVAPDHYSQTDSPSAQQYTPHQEVRARNSFPTAAAPAGEYSAATPASARSAANFPQEYLARQHYTPGSASMAQPPNPSIAQSSPTYPPHYAPYGAAPGPHDMSHYSGHPAGNYGHWGGQGYAPHPHGMPYSSPGPAGSAGGSPATAGPPRPGQQVYSFVPIPGAQQHKRPRRRYEEIERMYKCGHQGCEKAYGTLNHLNAHVTMQSHGQKRTPEEFKEIRKEWKARKKEDETMRKNEDERSRSTAGASEGNGTDPAAQTPTSQNYPPGVRNQLPPISGGQFAAGYPPGSEGMYQGNGQQMYSTYPHSPYQPGGAVYPQHSEAPSQYGAP